MTKTTTAAKMALYTLCLKLLILLGPQGLQAQTVSKTNQDICDAEHPVGTPNRIKDIRKCLDDLSQSGGSCAELKRAVDEAEDDAIEICSEAGMGSDAESCESRVIECESSSAGGATDFFSSIAVPLATTLASGGSGMPMPTTPTGNSRCPTSANGESLETQREALQTKQDEANTKIGEEMKNIDDKRDAARKAALAAEKELSDLLKQRDNAKIKAGDDQIRLAKTTLDRGRKIKDAILDAEAKQDQNRAEYASTLKAKGMMWDAKVRACETVRRDEYDKLVGARLEGGRQNVGSVGKINQGKTIAKGKAALKYQICLREASAKQNEENAAAQVRLIGLAKEFERQQKRIVELNKELLENDSFKILEEQQIVARQVSAEAEVDRLIILARKKVEVAQLALTEAEKTGQETIRGLRQQQDTAAFQLMQLNATSGGGSGSSAGTTRTWIEAQGAISKWRGRENRYLGCLDGEGATTASPPSGTQQ